MAKQPGYQSRSTNSGTGELKSRLLFVLGALIVYRIGSFIPLPGIDAAVLAQLVEQQKGTIIDMLNMFSGGALSRASILALGIMPYISASIVMQLLATVSPALAELKKEGAAGQRKITKYTRYATVVFATIQAIAISTGLPNMLPPGRDPGRQKGSCQRLRRTPRSGPSFVSEYRGILNMHPCAVVPLLIFVAMYCYIL